MNDRSATDNNRNIWIWKIIHIWQSHSTAFECSMCQFPLHSLCKNCALTLSVDSYSSPNIHHQYARNHSTNWLILHKQTRTRAQSLAANVFWTSSNVIIEQLWGKYYELAYFRLSRYATDWFIQMWSWNETIDVTLIQSVKTFLNNLHNIKLFYFYFWLKAISIEYVLWRLLFYLYGMFIR